MNKTTAMKGVIVLSIVFYFAPICIWWFVMVVENNYVLSLNNSDWGAFGSFVGGILSPLFGLLSVIFIYLSIMESNKNNQKQIGTIHKQERINYLLVLINSYNEKLSEKLEEQSEFFDNRLISVYADGSKLIPHPKGSVRQALLGFHLSIDSKREFVSEYISYMQYITANVGLCFYSIVSQLSEIDDEIELKQSVDLVQAIADFHGTNAFLELSLQRMMKEESVPLFEKMLEINKRVIFWEEYLSKYCKAKEFKKI
ncbi:hypothetical protein [Vibrio fluvialis]|uniref:hypothetical protein n=1 Tax=Vibrio fluvialis TaxID=676 RepID=UPI002ACDA7E9|nr:hypothetical protein [Vibrio fluvialis]